MVTVFDRISRQSKIFVTIAIFSLIVASFIYGEVQHVLRSTANDPQIQAAEDIASAIRKGDTPKNKVPNYSIDIDKSLSVFVIIYDNSGNPIASSGMLNGKIPIPSKGIFDLVKNNGEDRFTWQPQDGVRIAAVVTRYEGQDSGYVLVGRSLKEVAAREHSALLMAFLGWIVLVMAGTSISFLFFHNETKPEHHHHI